MNPDLGAIQIYLERVYDLYTPSKLKSILLAIAAERSYHPVRDYVESLPAWDGVPEWTRCSSIIWEARIRCTSAPLPER